jgi:hypothetical protein
MFERVGQSKKKTILVDDAILKRGSFTSVYTFTNCSNLYVLCAEKWYSTPSFTRERSKAAMSY